MGEPMPSYEPEVAPRIIKISRKRQITIPAEMFEKSGFSDYAFVTWHEDGSIDISPIDVRDEGDSVKLLRSLLAQGFDGEDLINEYERLVHPVIDYKAAIDQSLRSVEEGAVRPFGELRREIGHRYGL